MNKQIGFLIIIMVFSLPNLSQNIDMELLNTLPESVQKSVLSRNSSVNDLSEDYPLSEPKKGPSRLKKLDSYGSEVAEVFGKSLFENVNNDFPLQLKTAPSDYILGPGDILNVNFSGSLQYSKRIKIDREGQFFLEEIGPINLSGLSYENAQIEIDRISKASLIGVKISITLSKLRPVQLFVVGNSNNPGSYVLNALSSINNVLSVSGGPSEVGSFRNISLKRNDKLIRNIDMYDLFIRGNSATNVRIQSGDVLLINPVGKQVKIFGEVRRPAIYELQKNEGLKELLTFASGTTSLADFNKVTLTRTTITKNNKAPDVKELTIEELSQIKLKDGDQIFIHANATTRIDANKNNYLNITLTGAFKNPGTYSFKKGETLSSILERAGGYTESAYLLGGVFIRREVKEREKKALLKAADALENAIVSALTSGQLADVSDARFALTVLGQFVERLRTTEPKGRVVTEFDIDKISQFKELDFILSNGDSIFMPEKMSTITVTGEILTPMSFVYIESLKAEDYINLAGGYNQSADKDKTFIILPNGQSVKPVESWFSSKTKIKPGSTIIVTRDTTRLSQLALWKAVLPIFSNLVQTLAAIDALSD